MRDLDRILQQVSRPARYSGAEWNSVIKDWENIPLRLVLSYPDLYELGMSTLALHILYEIINSREDVLAERVFAPWPDMESLLRRENMPLFSLESRHPLGDFDVIGFSLGYELTYTNVLNMLDMAGIPVLADDRDQEHPLIMAGGSCALNPEPMSDFIDFFVIGEGEEVITEVLDCLREGKGRSEGRKRLLEQLASIPGIYVPRLYRPEYDANGLFREINPLTPAASPRIERRIVSQLPPPPKRPVVPYIETVHDRANIEIQRGCSRGCRFCQAGNIYRPVRERPPEAVLRTAGELISNCGYSEVSLVSLSSSDYPGIEELVSSLFRRYKDDNLVLSLPSLRIDNFSVRLLDSLASHKKPGLTFAPEAGSARLRQVINKDTSDDTILQTATDAFARGWKGLKLYFMLGLPTETTDDIEAIIDLVNKIGLAGKKSAGARPQIRISLSTFVPKPHTPFQWVAQDSKEKLDAKHEMLNRGLRRKSIRLSWHEPSTSLLEAALSRGDRRLGRVIYLAWKKGSIFDGWSEYFNYRNWLDAFAEAGLDPDFYALRQRPLDEPLPWSHIDIGLREDFLKKEYQRSLENSVTADCRHQKCNACGLERWHNVCRSKYRQIS
ncbi:MAG: TIGR03960 family B12-binding radical SAM protein [Dehalococcoidales bacterium]